MVDVGTRRSCSRSRRSRSSTSGRCVSGPDGAPFVLDAATRDVYRIDLANGKASAIFREGNKAAGATQGVPQLLAVGGRDLLMVDDEERHLAVAPREHHRQGHDHPGARERRDASGATTSARSGRSSVTRGEPLQLLRRRPVRAAGPSVLAGRGRGRVPGSAEQVAVGSTRRQRDQLAVHRRRHLARRRRQAAPCRQRQHRRLGAARRRATRSFAPSPPTAARVWRASGATGTIYGFDPASDRVVALSKVNGTYLEQYRLAGGADGWADFRACTWSRASRASPTRSSGSPRDRRSIDARSLPGLGWRPRARPPRARR